MAASKCPSCENKSFEMQEIQPSGSKWKYQAVQCSKCGSVVGVVEYFNVSALVSRIIDHFKIK
jgi:predicted nucleic-acid-binding Zn-ribbon protein